MPTPDDIRHHESRLAREPSAQAFAALGEAYRRAGRLDETIRVAREGLERYPDYATTRFVLGKALLDQDDVPSARAEIERFLRIQPDHEPALRIAAECALRMADPPAALGYLRRLATLDPDDRLAQAQLRAVEVASGGAPPTRDGGLWPVLGDDTFATVTFGDLCLAQGLLDEATTVFSRIVLRRPDHDVARARLAELGRARTQARRPRG